MRFNILVIFCLLGLLVFVFSEKIPLNSRCPLINEIDSMDHNIARTVTVKLHLKRRCNDPSLILRLSGTALYKLHYHGLVNNTQIYHYPVLIDPGVYFLEAVIIFCSSF